MLQTSARSIFYRFFIKKIKSVARSVKGWQTCGDEKKMYLLVTQLLLRTDAIPSRPYFIYRRLYRAKVPYTVLYFLCYIRERSCIEGITPYKPYSKVF